MVESYKVVVAEECSAEEVKVLAMAITFWPAVWQ